MPLKEEKQLEGINTKETRQFNYSKDESEVKFEFDVDVSNPEIAIAEISDFMDLMAQAFNDLTVLQKEFSSKIEKPKEEKEKKEKKEEGKPGEKKTIID